MSETNPLEEIKAKAWNESISPRLEALRAWFESTEWTQGIAPYLRGRFDAFLDKKLAGNSTLTHEQEKFIDGQMAMLRELLTFPQVIRQNIELADQQKKQNEARAHSVGSAGY